MSMAYDKKTRRIFQFVEVLWAYTDIEEAVRSALELLKDTIYFERAMFWVMDPLAAVPSGPPITHNVPFHIIRDYIRNVRLHVDDQAYKATRSAGLKIARSTDVLNYDEWTQTDIFNNIYLPYNGYYQLGCELREQNLTYGVYSIFRRKSLGDFTERDMAVMHLLYPHLVNRLKWQKMLENSLLKPAHVTDHHTRVLTSLTSREIKVAQEILAGATNKETAEVLHISVNTVKLYLKNIYAKLGIHSRSQLAALYHIWE